jgi:hypothetical protein
MRSNALRNAVLTGLVAIASAAALTACGSSKPAAPKAHRSPFIAFSKCMRDHGVTNFPDPTSGGGGINIGGSGIDPQSPAFQAAQNTCFKLLPGGGPFNRTPSAEQIRRATETSECMRKHGVTGFPDPIISSRPPTGLSPANYSQVIDDGGIVIAIPKSINPRSPAFESAAKVCKFGG